MPPKAKITKQMILDTVLEITRETGFETVNARSIANRLGCSTRPIFTCYENMDALKQDFLSYAFAYYTQYVADYSRLANPKPALLLPLSYIEFAREETHLFQLIFVSDMDLDMRAAEDFYRELGNEEKAKTFSEMIGADPVRGKQIFLDLFLYAHGMAVLTAAGKLSLGKSHIEKMLQNFLSAFTPMEKSGPIS